MRKAISVIIMAALMAACHESLEDRAAREAREYTEKYCPTPVVNGSRTDSVAFDRTTLTYTYYCSFLDQMDSPELISSIQPELQASLRNTLRQDVALKKIKEAGFNFAYVVRSASHPDTVLYTDTIRPEHYRGDVAD